MGRVTKYFKLAKGSAAAKQAQTDADSAEKPAENPKSSSKVPPDLAKVAAAWRRLPDHVKQAILTLVEAGKGKGA